MYVWKIKSDVPVALKTEDVKVENMELTRAFSAVRAEKNDILTKQKASNISKHQNIKRKQRIIFADTKAYSLNLIFKNISCLALNHAQILKPVHVTTPPTFTLGWLTGPSGSVLPPC